MAQGTKNKKYFWVTAIAPLTSVIVATVFVGITRADKHGVSIVSARSFNYDDLRVLIICFQLATKEMACKLI